MLSVPQDIVVIDWVKHNLLCLVAMADNRGVELKMSEFGLQKLTLLDYPGRMAATVFVPGCNFRCPFCHNAFLVENIDRSGLLTRDELLAFLQKRSGVLEGVCITGGEPLMDPALPELIARIKELDYLVKLDTNGSYPERLKSLLDAKLIDYAAMDVKNTLSKYAETAGIANPEIVDRVRESIGLLKNSGVDYEFRTTVAKPLHEVGDFVEIGEMLSGAKRYFLQKFVDSGSLLSRKLTMSAFSDAEMAECLQSVRRYVAAAELRGV